MGETLRVLVCGGRDFDNYMFVSNVLWSIHHDTRIAEIIHGGAKGADFMADLWAKRNWVPVAAYQADWKAHGKAAGPIRNARMLAEGKPDLVVAFPGGKGTADMVRQAKAAGVRVVEP